MIRIRLMVISLALLALGVARVEAQSHPSFAGSWVLDPAKTVADGGASAPEAASRVVVQHGDTLTVDTETSAMGTLQKTHLVWGLDGKPWKNTVTAGGEQVEVASVLTWDKATLVIRTELSVQGMSVQQTDRWTMAADGKSLTAVRSLTVDGNENGSLTLIYNKKI